MAHSDISQSIGDARRAARICVDSGSAAAETMAVYAELGELLETGRTDPGFEAECRELAGRLVVLHRLEDAEWEERWAVWCTRNMDLGGAR